MQNASLRSARGPITVRLLGHARARATASPAACPSAVFGATISPSVSWPHAIVLLPGRNSSRVLLSKVASIVKFN